MLFFILLATDLFSQKGKTDTTRTLDPAADFFKAARKLQDSMHYKEAIRQYEKAIKKRKDFAEAYNNIAFCYLELHDYERAQENLAMSLKYQPDNFNCIKYLGRTCFLNKKFAEAKKYYEDAQKLDPVEPELMCFIAELRSLGADDKGALEMYNQVILERDNYALAWLNRGLLKYKMKQYSYAIKDIEQGLKLYKYQRIADEVYTSLATAKFESGDFKGAIRVFDTLIRRNPRDEFALTYRGASKIEVNDFSAAIADLEEAIKLNGKSYVAYNFRGTAKAGLKQYVEALKDFDQAIKIKFNYPSTYVNRAAVKMASKDRKGACEDLNKADQLGSNIAYKLIQQYCGGTDY
jgi:tetratricopeptide (TPR) repeat protein